MVKFKEFNPLRLQYVILPTKSQNCCDSCTYMGGSQKRCTMGGDRVRDCITHLLSIKSLNVDDIHVSVAINI